jgi:hypothetical protein
VNENEDGNGKKRFFKLKNKTVKYGENEPKKANEFFTLTAVRPDSCQSEKFQARFHPLCIQLKYMKLNWSFVSQKKHHTSIQAYKSKNKKGNSVQCSYSFFETLLYLKSTLENTARLNNKTTDDSLVDF